MSVAKESVYQEEKDVHMEGYGQLERVKKRTKTVVRFLEIQYFRGWLGTTPKSNVVHEKVW